MFKPIIALTSLIAGASVAAGIVYMQSRPLAFTTVAAEQPALMPPIAVRVEPVVSTFVEEESALVPPPLVPKRAVKAAAAPQRPPEPPARTLAPCSEWSEIGVQALAGPEGPQPRSVRMLCSQ
jgi:hypothetical protein